MIKITIVNNKEEEGEEEKIIFKYNKEAIIIKKKKKKKEKRRKRYLQNPFKIYIPNQIIKYSIIVYFNYNFDLPIKNKFFLFFTIQNLLYIKLIYLFILKIFRD